MCKWKARLILSEVEGSGPMSAVSQFFHTLFRGDDEDKHRLDSSRLPYGRAGPPRRVAQPLRLVDGDDDLADRPEREPGELHMRPGKGQADDGEGEHHPGDEMAERQPPSGEDQPAQSAQRAERPGADIPE